MRRRLEFETFSVDHVDQPRRLLFHLDHEAFDQAAEVAEENHGWNGDHQAESRVIQRHGNAVGQFLGVGSGGRLRAEDLDHADDGAEQAHQRADRGDSPERCQKALQFVCHRAAGLLDRVLHDVARTPVVAKTRSQYLAERRILRELFKHVLTHSLLLVCSEHLLEQAARYDPLLTKDHEPFDDERYRDNRHGEQEIDRPAGSMDDGKQARSPSETKSADTLACDCGFGKAKNSRGCASCTQKISETGALLAAHAKRANGLNLYPQILWIRLCIP